MVKRAILITLCMWALMGTAFATPSTLIWIPSTDIQAAGTSHFGLDVYAPSNGDSTRDIGLTFGGGGKFEYGIDVLGLESASLDDPVRLNAKMLLVDETPSIPRVVVGMFDVGDDTASNQAYILGSKTFSFARATFGYSIGKERVLGDDNNMLLLGLDKMINNKWWAAVDYQGGKSAFGALSAGVAYSFTPNSSLIVGYDWYNDSALDDTLTMQYDVNF